MFASTSGGGPDEVWLPKCRQVWAGSSLPAGYFGCQTGVVGWAPWEFTTPCSSGPDLYFYDGQRWAYSGGVIHAPRVYAADDPAYKAAWRKCRGISA